MCCHPGAVWFIVMEWNMIILFVEKRMHISNSDFFCLVVKRKKESSSPYTSTTVSEPAS